MPSSDVPTEDKPLEKAVALQVLEHLKSKADGWNWDGEYFYERRADKQDSVDLDSDGKVIRPEKEVEEYETFLNTLIDGKRKLDRTEMVAFDVYATRLEYLFGMHAHLLLTLDYSETPIVQSEEDLGFYKRLKVKKMAEVEDLDSKRTALDNFVYKDGDNFQFSKDQLNGAEEISKASAYHPSATALSKLTQQEKVVRRRDAEYIKFGPERLHMAFATWKAAFFRVFLMYAKEDWHHYSMVMGDKVAKGDGKGPTHDEVVQAYKYYKDCILPIQLSDDMQYRSTTTDQEFVNLRAFFKSR